ncbi:MAG TPA: SMP-30/gluconolactonase/LRE family protein [Gemmatimonadaceae bacterium]|nr:SMP-30/gluconolactonase/LRE family protein [Gemmatimonadaceae bacterium]
MESKTNSRFAFVISVCAIFAAVALVSGIGHAQGGRGGGRGQDQGPPPPKDVVAPAIPGVVAAGTPIELVAYPVAGTEGPVRLLDGSGILFTERNVSHITKVDLNGNRSTFVESAEGANGIGWDTKGRLIAVLRPRSGEKVAVLYPPASVATLADNVDGKPFNALNDLVVSTKDGIYFTDTQGIYFVPPGGKAKKVVDLKNMNGATLSNDEKTLYANHKDGEYVLAFDVQPDGSLKNQRNFGKYKSVTMPGSPDPQLTEDNGADGMAIDADGRVYTATNVGVEVFSPKGDYLGAIPIGLWGGEQNRLRKPQNLTFAGPDRKLLYTVGSNAIYRVKLLASGIKSRGK